MTPKTKPREKVVKQIAHLIVEDWMAMDKRQKERLAKWLEGQASNVRNSKFNYAKKFKAILMPFNS